MAQRKSQEFRLSAVCDNDRGIFLAFLLVQAILKAKAVVSPEHAKWNRYVHAKLWEIWKCLIFKSKWTTAGSVCCQVTVLWATSVIRDNQDPNSSAQNVLNLIDPVDCEVWIFFTKAQ